MKRFVTTAALAFALAGCGSQEHAPVELGKVAPSFQLPNLKQSMVSSDAIQDDIVVITFWSTSCLNCLHEMEDLKQIEKSGTATVVGIALDDDSERVQRLVEKRQVNYQILLGDQKVFERFDGINIPYTLVLDKNRTIRKKFFGPMTKAQFDETVNSIRGKQDMANASASAHLQR